MMVYVKSLGLVPHTSRKNRGIKTSDRNEAARFVCFVSFMEEMDLAKIGGC